jgi:hypothetical protein
MKNPLLILVMVALLAFIFFREATRCSRNPFTTDTIRTTQIIPGDSIPYEVPVLKPFPIPVYRDTGSTRWMDLPIDTMAILADYYSKYYYDDTLQNDTSALIRVLSHTFENRLYYDKLFFQNKRATQINTTIITQSDIRKKFLIGAGMGIIPGKPFISVDALLLYPSGIAFGAGYDVMGQNLIVKGYYHLQRKKK